MAMVGPTTGYDTVEYSLYPNAIVHIHSQLGRRSSITDESAMGSFLFGRCRPAASRMASRARDQLAGEL